jgi:hypothetical protein
MILIDEISQETGEGLHYKDTNFPPLHQETKALFHSYKDI